MRRWTKPAAAAGVLGVIAAILYGGSGAERATETDFATVAQVMLAESVAGTGDYFLKLDGIEGESTDVRHAKELDISSWKWGVSNGASSGIIDASKATFSNLEFVAPTSKASPLLMLASAGGTHLKEAKLTVRKSGGEQQDYLFVTLSDVVVAAYQTSGDGGAPVDKASLAFNRIKVEYRPQNPDGSLGPAVVAEWDLKANKKVG